MHAVGNGCFPDPSIWTASAEVRDATRPSGLLPSGRLCDPKAGGRVQEQNRLGNLCAASWREGSTGVHLNRRSGRYWRRAQVVLSPDTARPPCPARSSPAFSLARVGLYWLSCASTPKSEGLIYHSNRTPRRHERAPDESRPPPPLPVLLITPADARLVIVSPGLPQFG